MKGKANTKAAPAKPAALSMVGTSVKGTGSTKAAPAKAPAKTSAPAAKPKQAAP